MEQLIIKLNSFAGGVGKDIQKLLLKLSAFELIITPANAVTSKSINWTHGDAYDLYFYNDFTCLLKIEVRSVIATNRSPEFKILVSCRDSMRAFLDFTESSTTTTGVLWLSSTKVATNLSSIIIPLDFLGNAYKFKEVKITGLPISSITM